MNNQPAGAVQDAQAQALAVLRRRAQSIKAELDNSYAKLRQALRMRDELYYPLFPPVRPDRNPQNLVARVEQLREESQRLQKALTNQEAELQVLNEKEGAEGHSLLERIAQGCQNLANLKTRLAETRIDLHKTEGLLSPIRLLPDDVLGEIFSYCRGSRLSISSLIPPPLAITHTCSSWRSIAINKPDLWTNIRISIDDNQDKDGWPFLVQLWLERSHNFPLSFSISEDAKHDYRLSCGSVFFRILDLFTPHSQRWKSARISNAAFAVSDLKWFSKLSDHASFPLLESMTLKCLTLDNIDIDKIMDMLKKSPRLHSISWKIKSPSTIPTFPWTQLTTLDLLLIISLDELLDILSQAQQLVYADLNFFINPSPMQDHYVTHASLQTLHLGYAGKLQNLLNSLTLPKLISLTVDALPAIFALDAVLGSWPQKAFISFLQRSRCKLESFSMSDLSPSPTNVLSILQHLSPSLVRFALESSQGTCVTNEVLLALTYPSSTLHSKHQLDDMEVEHDKEEEFASVLCPSLRHIKLWGCMDTTDGVLADMVLSRLSPDIQSAHLVKLHSGEFGVPELLKLPQDEERLANLQPHNISYVVFDSDE